MISHAILQIIFYSKSDKYSIPQFIRYKENDIKSYVQVLILNLIS